MLGFRVWDTVLNKMTTEWSQCAISMSGNPVYPDGYGVFNPTDRYIPMQSTGIFDWQGKPIFEGDMLFIKFSEKAARLPEYYLVENIKDFLMAYGYWQSKRILYSISNDGNIYEHPSLLERLK